jgi:hypothetical protein
MRKGDRGQHSANCSERRLGYGFGVNAAACVRDRRHLVGAKCLKRQPARWRTLYQLRLIN